MFIFSNWAILMSWEIPHHSQPFAISLALSSYLLSHYLSPILLRLNSLASSLKPWNLTISYVPQRQLTDGGFYQTFSQQKCFLRQYSSHIVQYQLLRDWASFCGWRKRGVLVESCNFNSINTEISQMLSIAMKWH